MEKLTITVNVDKHYGGYLFYPECDNAKIFAELAKTKTLSYQAIKLIKQLGYEVVSKDMSYPVEAI
jgi:hypothetical protein